jgi:hypothetical protein
VHTTEGEQEVHRWAIGNSAQEPTMTAPGLDMVELRVLFGRKGCGNNRISVGCHHFSGCHCDQLRSVGDGAAAHGSRGYCMGSATFCPVGNSETKLYIYISDEQGNELINCQFANWCGRIAYCSISFIRFITNIFEHPPAIPSVEGTDVLLR